MVEANLSLGTTHYPGNKETPSRTQTNVTLFKGDLLTPPVSSFILQLSFELFLCLGFISCFAGVLCISFILG